MFARILIANRGEIACRVIRTARDMGLETVAIYSVADRGARHVTEADEAVLIDAGSPLQSYLDIDKIIAAAERTGAQAIHPGYGFLSENPNFAQACADAGLTFIGPRPETITAMGLKDRAKDLMREAGVPITPGYQGADQSLEAFEAAAKDIGYPVLLKAAAGGGGKGMRRVDDAAEMAPALEAAQREAQSAFGDDTMLMEKFVSPARHVEVQIVGDSHGTVVHLFERDCSLQRRHQKVIEEAPAPHLPAAVRARLFEAAVNAAKAIGYVGAGTVEFLYDGADDVYFMEMNTRLQVEHPVTELITGIDLVEWQVRIAAGERLPLGQADIKAHGWAVEARICAEDPARDFFPATGTLSRLVLPEGRHIRIDSGLLEGNEISAHYDPMILKLIVWGTDREAAFGRLAGALEQTRISGLETNTRFLHSLAVDETVLAGSMTTRTIEDFPPERFANPSLRDMPLVCAALWMRRQHRQTASQSVFDADPYSAFASLGPWRVNLPAEEQLWIAAEDGPAPILITDEPDGAVTIAHPLGTTRVTDHSIDASGHGRLVIDNRTTRFFAAETSAGLRIWIGPDAWTVTPADPHAGAGEGAGAEGSLVAPMPGTVTLLLKAPGDAVEAGETLLVMEAMKMEYSVLAPSDGTVTAFRFGPGDSVTEGDLLIDFEAGESA
ncbi:MAG: acetyl-CoA carboxylase biotin carboxylase subunit [Pseudomonadota bacterium]